MIVDNQILSVWTRKYNESWGWIPDKKIMDNIKITNGNATFSIEDGDYMIVIYDIPTTFINILVDNNHTQFSPKFKYA